MKEDEIIGILKRILGEEDLDFLQKLDEHDLIKLLIVVREKISMAKGLY